MPIPVPFDAAALAEADLLHIALEAADFRRAKAAAHALALRADHDLANLLGKLIDGLRHPDVLIQRRAAQALALLGCRAEPAVNPLVEVSRGPHWTAREAALQTLGSLAATSVVARSALVRAALHDREAHVRRTAAQVLSAGGQTDSVVPELVQALSHHYPRVRCRALRALILFEARRGELLPLFGQMLGESHAKVRQVAAEVLGECGPAGLACVPALLRRLGDGEARVHTAAAAALARLRSFLSPAAQAILDVLTRPRSAEENLRTLFQQPGLAAASPASLPTWDEVSGLLQAVEEAAAAQAPAGRQPAGIRVAARQREVFRWQARLWQLVRQGTADEARRPGNPMPP